MKNRNVVLLVIIVSLICTVINTAVVYWAANNYLVVPLESKLTQFQGAYEELQTNHDQFQGAFIKLQTAYNELRELYSKLQASQNHLQDTYMELQNAHNKLQDTYMELQNDHNKLQANYTMLTRHIPYHSTSSILELKNQPVGNTSIHVMGTCGQDYLLLAPINANTWKAYIIVTSKLVTQPIHIILYEVTDKYPPDFSAQPYAKASGTETAIFSGKLNPNYAYVVCIRDAYAKPFTGRIKETWY